MSEAFQYLGSSLTHDDYEMLALARIPEPLRREEPALFKTKWFDYRHLHPVSATYMYAARYVEAVRDIYAQTRDRDEAATIQPFEVEDIFYSRELTSVWRARQALDRLGIRYEFALRFAMTRFANRGWSYFPRPNQLYTEELMLDTRDAWNLACSHTLQIAKHPRFTAPYYTGHPDQIAYQEWLVEQVRKREHPHRALSRLLSEKVIIPDFANVMLGKGILAKAIVSNAV